MHLPDRLQTNLEFITAVADHRHRIHVHPTTTAPPSINCFAFLSILSILSPLSPLSPLSTLSTLSALSHFQNVFAFNCRAYASPSSNFNSCLPHLTSAQLGSTHLITPHNLISIQISSLSMPILLALLLLRKHVQSFLAYLISLSSYSYSKIASSFRCFCNGSCTKIQSMSTRPFNSVSTRSTSSCEQSSANSTPCEKTPASSHALRFDRTYVILCGRVQTMTTANTGRPSST